MYYTNGTVFELPRETIKAVDKFVVPKGFQRSGCREQSFITSLGVYVKPVDPNDRRHKYYCRVSGATFVVFTFKTTEIGHSSFYSPVK